DRPGREMHEDAAGLAPAVVSARPHPREPDSLFRIHSHGRRLRQVFGLTGGRDPEGVRAGLLAALPRRMRPSVLATEVPDYRCGAVPEWMTDIALDSLLSPPVKADTAGGRTIGGGP